MLLSFIPAAAVLLLPVAVSAHVVVTPNRAGIGQELVFHLSVPNERESAVTSVKLDIPKGVSDVSPTTAPGWTIATEKNGDSDISVTWQGDIPVGQRGDFSFSAQVPGGATRLAWKAYQTYTDGVVVHWDQDPATAGEAGNAGPYSVTKVVSDLSLSADSTSSSTTSKLALVFSVAAFALSVTGLFLRRKR